MKYSIALTLLAATIGMVNQASAADFVEGKDYRVVTKPDVIKGNAIIVREFFYYACPHCYQIEPYVEKWKKSKPTDVAFFASPAAMNPVWETSARGFYTAQLMGYEAQTHAKLYDAIFKNGQSLIAGNDKQAMINWYASQGLDQDKFTNTLSSFAVNAKIARNNAAAKRYQLTGTPSVVVNGKYVVNPAEPEKTLEIVDFLIKKVRAEKK